MFGKIKQQQNILLFEIAKIDSKIVRTQNENERKKKDRENVKWQIIKTFCAKTYVH